MEGCKQRIAETVNSLRVLVSRDDAMRLWSHNLWNHGTKDLRIYGEPRRAEKRIQKSTELSFAEYTDLRINESTELSFAGIRDTQSVD